MRKGQMTIVIIVGIVLLLVIGLFLLPTKQTPASVQAQQDSAAVTALVQQCLAQEAENSIRTIASQGFMTNLQSLKESPCVNGITCKDTQIITIPPQKIPLWHEIQTCPQSKLGCVKDHRPALCAPGERCPVQEPAGDTGQSVQQGIEQLTAQQIDGCLNDFAALESINVKRSGEPTVKATIREDDVALQLTYPLTITTTDKQTVDLEDFTSAIDVKLPQLYRLARGVQWLERSNGFMEEVFMNLLSVYWGINEPLPPNRDLQIGGTQKTWRRAEVQRTIEEGLLPFMDFVQIVNAERSYIPFEETRVDNETQAYANGIYQYMAIKLEDNNTYPLGVKFEYPRTPMFLDINGDELLKPRKVPDIGGMLGLLGLEMRDYRFKYSVSYPLVVHMTDPAAFNGRGLQLDYAMEVNIRNNHALNTSEQFQQFSFGQDTLDLSDPNQLVNHIHQFKVYDARTGKPLQARISYACDARYTMGETDATGLWAGKLPYCLAGGYVIVDNDNYARQALPLVNTEEDGATGNIVDVKLWPLKTKRVIVYKLTTSAVNNITLDGNIMKHRANISQKDSVMFTMNKVKITPYDDEIPITPALTFNTEAMKMQTEKNLLDIKKDLDDALKQGQMTQSDYNEMVKLLADVKTQTGGLDETPPLPSEMVYIDLVPGKYELNGVLTYNGRVQILQKKTADYTLDAQNFSSWISGGVVFKDTSAVLLSPEEIYDDNVLVLYVLEQSFIKYVVLPNGVAQTAEEVSYPTTWDDILKYKPIEDYQGYGRRDMAKPTFE